MKIIKKLKVIELFAGLGAYSKALKRLNLNFEVLAAIENDEKTIHSYNLLHGSNYEPIDITDVDEKSMPDCDVICYSPPCQAFSNAGKQLGFEDKRGILFFDALRIIKEKKPKYCMMENVKGLTQKKFENEFKSMLDSLKEVGYTNYWKVINAKDYGIPQNRERVFIISIRSDIDQEFKFPEPTPLRFELKDALDEDAQLPILHNIYGGFKEIKPRIFNDHSPTLRTPAGGGHIPSVIVKGCSLRTRSYMGQPQRLEVRKDDFSNAITTVGKDYMIAIKGVEYNINNLPKGYKVVGDYLTRELNQVETFRLMGFDEEDAYILDKNNVSKRQMLKMAGNSIVVDVLEKLFVELFGLKK